MRQDDGFGDEIGDDLVDHRSGGGRIGPLLRLVASPAALAISSLVIALASLLTLGAASDIGDTALFSSRGRNLTELTEVRTAAGVRLVVAVIALVLAVAAAYRSGTGGHATEESDDNADDEADHADPDPAVPTWLAGLAGAALIVSVVAVVVTAVAFGYAMQATSGPAFSALR